MIYTYKYLDSRIQLFHENIAYFFRQLFDHSPAEYDETLLLHPDFVEVVKGSKTRLEGNLISITKIYYELSFGEKSNLRIAFSKNSSISSLCEETDIQPSKYDSLHINIRERLKEFFEMLWNEYPQNNLIQEQFGTIQDHFNEFTNEAHQKALVCPFCGLMPLKPTGGKKRNPYDHYIPQAFYPFVSINFFNMVPACWDCNTDEKSDIDTLYLNNDRRKLLNPFDSDYNGKELKLTIIPLEAYNPDNLKTLLQEISYDYEFTLEGISDPRLKSWDEIYSIKRRYKEYLAIFEKTWFDELKKQYKRKLLSGIKFGQFREEFFEDLLFQKLFSVFGMLKLSYFSFVFTLDDFENRLAQIVYDEI